MGVLARAPARALGAAAQETRVAFANIRARYFPRGAVMLKADPGRKDAAPPDPAKLFAPSAPLSPERDRNAPLSAQLEACAREMVDRKLEIDRQALGVARRIAERVDGEVTLIAQGLRVFIVTGWAFLAVVLAWRHATSAPWTAFLGEIRPEALLPLAEAFAILAIAGFVVAMLRAFIVFALGKGDNRKLRGEAHRLGDLAADAALRFDAALSEARHGMDSRAHAADAVKDLSRAHLTALEAAVFFRSLPFLGEGEREEARLKFAGYLRDVAPPPARESFELPAGLLGFIIGALYMRGLYPADPEIFAGSALPPIAEYGWAVGAILGGAMLYVLAGLFVDLFRAAFTAGTRLAARDEAVDAVRSAFLARNAPSIASIIQRISDALDVYRARLSRGADSPTHATDDTPSWRKAPEAPRFIGGSFQSAPRPFLADAPKRKK